MFISRTLPTMHSEWSAPSGDTNTNILVPSNYGVSIRNTPHHLGKYFTPITIQAEVGTAGQQTNCGGYEPLVNFWTKNLP